MDGHWDPLTPRQREEFVCTLRALLESKYDHALELARSYKVRWGTEQLSGEQASIRAVLRGPKPNDTVEVDVRMHEHAGQWLVWDLVVDEASQMREWRRSFERIINNQGFDALLAKMKKKLPG